MKPALSISVRIFLFVVACSSTVADVHANNTDIEALFSTYADAMKQGNVTKALNIFQGSDSKTIESQTKRAEKIKNHFGEIYIDCKQNKSSWLGWVIIMDEYSQPLDGFRFIAKRDSNDNKWVVKTIEIKKDDTWVSFYNSCAHYFHYQGESYNKERIVCDKIIADYSHVPNAAASAYRRIGDTYFLEAEKRVVQGESNKVSGELKEHYLRAIEAFEKGLRQKEIRDSTAIKIKLDLGISYYRTGDITKAGKHLQDIAGSTIGGMRSGIYYQDILKEWLEKVNAALQK